MAYGIGNASFSNPFTKSIPGANNVVAWQSSLLAGYRIKRWDFSIGIGYMKTGHAGAPLQAPSIYIANTGLIQYLSAHIYNTSYGTETDPHLVLPIRVRYTAWAISKRWAIKPAIGAALSNNLPRSMVVYNNQTIHETKEAFNQNANRFGVFANAQVGIVYKISDQFAAELGPSVYYSVLAAWKKEKRTLTPAIYDNAWMLNAGIRYYFGKKRMAKQHL